MLRIMMLTEQVSPITPNRRSSLSTARSRFVGALSRYLTREEECHVDILVRKNDISVLEARELQEGLKVLALPAGPPTPLSENEEIGFIQKDFFHMVRKLARHGGFNLLHADWWAGANVARRIKAETGIPFIVTFHTLGRVLRYEGGASGSFLEARIKEEEKTLEAADKVHVFAEQSCHDLVRLYGVEEDRIAVVPYAPDPAAFIPRSQWEAREILGIDDNRKMVIQPWYFRSREEAKEKIKSIEFLARSLTDCFFVLSVESASAGSEEAGRYPGLEDGFSKNENIFISNFSHPSDLSVLYSAADVALNCRWFEALCMSTIEARACGCLVPATKGAGPEAKGPALNLPVAEGERAQLLLELIRKGVEKSKREMKTGSQGFLPSMSSDWRNFGGKFAEISRRIVSEAALRNFYYKGYDVKAPSNESRPS